MESTNNYGLHILQRIGSTQQNLLGDADAWLLFMKAQIQQYGLGIVGEIKHTFSEGGGFTVALCLHESHVCVHTWHEENLLTFDIYLCNYSQNNESTARAIAEAHLAYWQGELQQNHEIQR
jgi:S-adenosylmethionine decarboxylase